MKIIHNAHKENQFKDLHMGDVFMANDNCVYIKIDEDCPYNAYNAVNLGKGSLVNFSDWEKVLIPKNVTLTIDE